MDICIPTHQEGYDVYFTQLTCDTLINGNDTTIEYDPYPDIMIGRCSVDTVTQVKNVVHKILHYKPDTLQWEKNMLNIVGTNTNEKRVSDALLYLEDVIEDKYCTKLAIPGDFIKPVPIFDTISYCLDSIIDAYMHGVKFFNYLGHGSPNSWGSPFIGYGLFPNEPDYNLPLVISCACATGKFQGTYYEDCIGEQILASDSVKGGIAFIGASISSSWGSMNLAADFQNSFLNNYSIIAGEALMEIKISEWNSLDNWIEHYNLLGDPALNIFYENTDTLKPDIVVDKIILEKTRYRKNDSLYLNVVVKNNMNIDVDTPFIVSCLLKQFSDSSNYLTAVYAIDSLQAYSFDTAKFIIQLPFEEDDYYEVLVVADTADVVDEMSKYNNIKKTEIQINDA